MLAKLPHLFSIINNGMPVIAQAQREFFNHSTGNKRMRLELLARALLLGKVEKWAQLPLIYVL